MSETHSKDGNASEPLSKPAVKLPKALSKAARSPGLGPFDKAFAVFVSGPQGVTNGVGRNITRGGMFVETREPYSIGTPVRITFTEPSLQTEITAVAEVRFQCFLNFAGTSGEQEGLRGMGIRFISFDDESDLDGPGPSFASRPIPQ